MVEKTERVADLSAQDLIAMARENPNVVRLGRGDVLFKNGDASTCMYVVRSGTLTIRNGPIIYEHIGPGDIVGEMVIVDTLEPRCALVHARTPAELVDIDECRFLSLVHEMPSFALTVMRVLSRRLRRMDDRYEGRNRL